MRFWAFISFLCVCVTASSQTFWSPVWMKDNVRMTGLSGTGNYLYINAAGQLSKVSGVGAAGVTGLSNQQILYGKSDGTIDQEAAFTYNETTNIATVIGSNVSDLGLKVITNAAPDYYSAMATDRIEVNGVDEGRLSIYDNYIQFYDPTALGTIQWVFNLGSTIDHNLYWPATQGGANTFLKNDGSGNLSWSAETYAGTVTSVGFATGTTGTDVNVTGSPITGSGTITLNIPDASTTARGLVTTGAQDIAGAKTFTSNIAFEGTADANETTLAITDPTADNTVTVQDITGTIPMAVGTPVSLTGQTAAIAATTAYTAPVDGYYAVYYNATVTTAATSSCVLGPFQVRYTEAHDNVVKTFPTSAVNFVNQTNRNNTDAAIGGVFTVHAKAGTDIQYIMGYTSSGATAMQYNLEVTIIKIR